MDLALLEKLLHAVADGSPIALLGLAGYVAYLVWKIAGNHLKHFETGIGKIANSMDRIAASSERQETALGEIRDGVSWLKGRLD
jgi:hypothetical protein